jgi:hypothetical protein
VTFRTTTRARPTPSSERCSVKRATGLLPVIKFRNQRNRGHQRCASEAVGLGRLP